jgi:hypothetical protein
LLVVARAVDDDRGGPVSTSIKVTITTDDRDQLTEILDTFAINRIAHARSVAEGRWEISVHFPDSGELARETYELARRDRQRIAAQDPGG